MQHSQSRPPALPVVTTAVAPRGVPASTNEVFPASPTYQLRDKPVMSRLQLSLNSWTQHHSTLQEVNHQVGPHDMGRTDVRAAAGGFQDVPQKCAESAMQKRSLRFCGKTCFPNKRATHFFSKPETRSTNQSPIFGKYSGQHVTVWNAKAYRCLLDSEVDN